MKNKMTPVVRDRNFVGKRIFEPVAASSVIVHLACQTGADTRAQLAAREGGGEAVLRQRVNVDAA
jgi:hypothetical protein